MATFKYARLLVSFLFCFSALGSIPVGAQRNDDEVTYIGAVLEYAPYDTWSDEGTGLEVLMINSRAIISYAEQAKAQFADILVAPEYGIQSLNLKRPDVNEFLTFMQYVPSPQDEIIPCELPEDTSRVDAMRILSCAAATLKMYLVIDLSELTPCNETIFDSEVIYWEADHYESCPPEGYYAYNTQVVFDRRGQIVARYRKIHLFLENLFTQGPEDAPGSIFLTDFDVLFSLQVCFDIVYTTPGYFNVKYANVRDIAMSTAWVDEQPFHLAVGVQYGMSRGLGANILVSGYHNPFKSKMGSGIYRGYAQESSLYVYDQNSINTLLVSTVTTRRASSVKASPMNNVVLPKLAMPGVNIPKMVMSERIYDGPTGTSFQHTMLQLDMSDFTTIFLDTVLPGETGYAYGCNEDSLCCSATYKYSGNLTYSMTVFSGHITEGGGIYKIGVQICALLYCESSTDIKSCGKLGRNLPDSDYFGPYELTSSSFTTADIFPSGFHRDFSILDYDELEYEETLSSHTIYSTKETLDFFGSALYARWYAIDP